MQRRSLMNSEESQALSGLYDRTDLSDEERAERADLKRKLKNAESVLAKIEEKKVS